MPSTLAGFSRPLLLVAHSGVGSADLADFVLDLRSLSVPHLLCQPLLLPVAAAFPGQEGYAGYRDYFLAKRAWFFGILAVVFCADIFDTLWKGQDYFASVGTKYPIRAAVYVVLCVIAMAVRNERFHAIFGVANWGDQLSWIPRTYNTLT